jgi:hypothetical protein
MSRTILKAVEGALGRRAFLNRIVTLGGAFLTGVLGFPKDSQATYLVLCCRLCKWPGDCTYAGCIFEWWWVCCYAGRIRHCRECMQYGEDCESYKTCSGVICSMAHDMGPAGSECPEGEECGQYPY